MMKLFEIFAIILGFVGHAYGQSRTIECVKSYQPLQIFRGIENEIWLYDSADYLNCDSVILGSFNLNTSVSRTHNCSFTIKTSNADTFINLFLFSPSVQDTFTLRILDIPKPQVYTEPELKAHGVSHYLIDSVFVYAVADRNKVNYELVDFHLELLSNDNKILSLYNVGPLLSEKNGRELSNAVKGMKTMDKIIIHARYKNLDGKDESVSRSIVIR